MKNEFEQFLIKKGYKQYTPSGNKSTVYSYIKSIDSVSEWENTDWHGLAENISLYLTQYDEGGTKKELGAKSHNTIICALRCFKEFVQSNR